MTVTVQGYFWHILQLSLIHKCPGPQSDFQIFTFLECKDDLNGLLTSQPITVVALSTAPASAGAITLCPLAPHPPAPQQLPQACQAGSSREPSPFKVRSCHYVLPGRAI